MTDAPNIMNKLFLMQIYILHFKNYKSSNTTGVKYLPLIKFKLNILEENKNHLTVLCIGAESCREPNFCGNIITRIYFYCFTEITSN